MGSKLWVVSHAATRATHEVRFGTDEQVLDPESISPVPVRSAASLGGPERRCQESAAALGWAASPVEQLRDLAAGEWSGQRLVDLLDQDAAGVQAWLSDPTVAPPGGESAADLVRRVGEWADGHDWAQGTTTAVVAPMVARALYLHLLSAPLQMFYAVHLEPLCALVLGSDGRRWQLRSLSDYQSWSRRPG